MEVTNRTERSPILWQAFLEVAYKTERSPLFRQAFLEVAYRTERTHVCSFFPQVFWGSRIGRSARHFFGKLSWRSRIAESARQFFGKLNGITFTGSSNTKGGGGREKGAKEEKGE